VNDSAPPADSPSADASAVQPLHTDEELEAILTEREEKEGKDVLALAKAGLKEDGPCPVCGFDLEAKAANPFLKLFVLRPTLHCDKCSFTSGPPPNTLGKYVLIPLTTIGFGYAGMQLIFQAQRLTEERGQMMTFLQGFMLFGVALFVWYSGMGAGNAKQRQGRILKHRRRWEDDQDGVTAPETSSLLGENLEAVVVAVILALIIRHFVMEAFVIPTGSMAPTLLGDHFDVECERCEFPFPISKREGEIYGTERILATATCPVCDYVFQSDRGVSDVRSGHKILVNKFIYRFRDPRRYEVVVFKFPRTPWRNYIKRLVGLPGELISIRNGDVFADGKRARRPDGVQDATWIPVHDARFKRTAGEPRWDVIDEEQRLAWTFGEGNKGDLDGVYMSCDPKGLEGQSWLTYRGRELRASYGYNRNDGSSGPVTADLRLRARVTGEDGAVVRLGILEQTRVYDSTSNTSRDLDRIVSARFSFKKAGQAEFMIEVDGKPAGDPVTLPALIPGKAYDLILAYADDRARLQVNGKTLVAFNDLGPEEQTYDARPRISVEGAPATIEVVRIDRDVHYVPSHGGRFDPSVEAVQVPKKSYFVMGDNSPNSEDGRKWGFVREGHMIGRAFLVFWPPTPEHLRLIR
jgi:signal peptidase I